VEFEVEMIFFFPQDKIAYKNLYKLITMLVVLGPVTGCYGETLSKRFTSKYLLEIFQIF